MSSPEPPLTNGDEALQRLMRGNARFVAAQAKNPNQSAERREQVAEGQMPFAIILGCSDSRVPLEIIFDQGLGDIFVVRVAGNIFDDAVVLGSIEFAAEVFHSPLLLVLGHAQCGAVTAAIEAVRHNKTAPGKIGEIVQAIRPVVEQVQGQPGDWLDNAVRANVRHVVKQLQNADWLKTFQSAGTLKIVGAYYALQNGQVELLD